MSKLIVVYGATGAQGGSLVKALLESTDFKVRAVTRDASADKAKALAALDDRVEIVESNLVGGDASKVLKGAYGLYLLTNFWDPSQMNKEFEVGKPVVDAAKNAGVEHIIYSSLANVEEQSGGKYHVPHFTDKAKLSDYIKKQNFKYFTEFYAAFYYQNFLHFFPPKEEDGVLTFTLPETSQMTAFDVNDTGKLVAPAFKDPETFNNKIIHASGYDGAPQPLVDTWGKVKGVKTKLNLVDLKTFSTFFEGADEMAQMFGWFNDFGYHGKHKTLEWQEKALAGGKLTTFEEWLKTQH